MSGSLVEDRLVEDGAVPHDPGTVSGERRKERNARETSSRMRERTRLGGYVAVIAITEWMEGHKK